MFWKSKERNWDLDGRRDIFLYLMWHLFSWNCTRLYQNRRVAYCYFLTICNFEYSTWSIMFDTSYLAPWPVHVHIAWFYNCLICSNQRSIFSRPLQAIRPHTDQLAGRAHWFHLPLNNYFSSPFWKSATDREYTASREERPLSHPLLRTLQHWWHSLKITAATAIR